MDQRPPNLVQEIFFGGFRFRQAFARDDELCSFDLDFQMKRKKIGQLLPNYPQSRGTILPLSARIKIHGTLPILRYQFLTHQASE